MPASAVKGLRSVLVLGRVSNLPTVWANVAAGWVLAGGAWDSAFVWLLVGASLLYVGGMTLNDAFDAGWDRDHAPERPIPSGAIGAPAVWALGFAWLALGSALLVFVAEAAWFWVLALVGAILFYDWKHKDFVFAVWVMGLCRLLLYPVAGSAALAASGVFGASELAAFPRELWIWGLALMAYVVGITRAARAERKQGARAVMAPLMLFAPLAFAGLMAGQSLGRAAIGEALGVVGMAVVLQLWVLYALARGRRKGIGPMVGALLAGMVLVDATAVAASELWLSACLIALLPLNLLLQRHIPAT